jgi:hypothetical protein
MGMTALLVTYGLNLATTRRVERFIEENYDSRVQLSASSYAIETDDEWPAQVYPRFEKLIGPGDQLYIITLRKGWDGQGTNETDDWLDATLPDAC